MKRVVRAIVVILSLVMVTGPAPGVEAQGQRVVLVHYYAWWSPDTMGPGISPDWPPTLYHSWDVALIQQHVAQIASANIDGMVVAWYGPEETNNQTENNFRVILDQAAANGISALLSVDLGTAAWFADTQQLIDGLNYALSVHANHPAYFRYNGRPVLFFWFQGRYSLDDWAYIRAQVDPDHNSIWLAEGAMPDAIPIFDGLYLYNIAWADNVYGTLTQWGGTVRGRGGIWVATAMPGFDNTMTQQGERYTRDRENGAFYRDTFAAAAASGPDMIVITSWNEWMEGTYIEPSQLYGDFYLNLTRDLAGEYRAGGTVSGGGSSAPPATVAAAPPAGATSGPALTPTGGAPATPEARPTSTLPPTITPTVPATATPHSTPTSLSLPAPASVAEDAGAASQAGGALAWLERAMADPTERRLIAGGLVAGGMGLALLGGAVILRRRE